MTAPSPPDSCFRCFCQCRHSVAWDDEIMCVKKRKTFSELTEDEIPTCKEFESEWIEVED